MNRKSVFQYLFIFIFSFGHLNISPATSLSNYSLITANNKKPKFVILINIWDHEYKNNFLDPLNLGLVYDKLIPKIKQAFSESAIEVVIVENPLKQDALDAFNDPRVKGYIWIGHTDGVTKHLISTIGESIRPNEFQRDSRYHPFEIAAFVACSSAACYRDVLVDSADISYDSDKPIEAAELIHFWNEKETKKAVEKLVNEYRKPQANKNSCHTFYQ